MSPNKQRLYNLFQNQKVQNLNITSQQLFDINVANIKVLGDRQDNDNKELETTISQHFRT